tara:strand:+ start:9307 stop:9528 length:222 start_codon:yes stop_codon:yes gene_type:complete
MSGIKINVYDIDPATERAKLEEKYGKDNVWDTGEMTEEFSVKSFVAPYVIVTRNGKEGTLQFQHYPRFYFDFK